MSRPILTVGPVAVAKNRVIGAGGDLPWRLKSDLALFKRTTMGKPVIMGRKTWDSLHVRPLPGRLNIVLSLDGSFEPARAVVCTTFTEAVEIAREQAAEDEVEEFCVIGGASLFAAALPKARRLYLTEVDAEPQGDVLFPEFDESDWVEASRETHPAGPDDDHPFVFRVLERR
jgi:dihydrofolate reductase